MNLKRAQLIAKIIAILILISVLRSWKMILLPLSLFQSFSWLTLLTVAMNFPAWLLCLFGSIGILLNKKWGYYTLYCATLFSIFACISYIPFIIYILPKSIIGVMVLSSVNVVITLILVWLQLIIFHKKIMKTV